ncbi:MAG: hypothetical protein WCA13_00435 [Terriglobales bacterium]
MKKLGFLMLLLAMTLMLGGNALAQGDNSVFFVTYYSNANTAKAPDGTLRLINDGDQSTTEYEGIPNGNLWASIYVFDDSQEMQECCNCYVSANGLLSESVDKELTANTLTGRDETSRGVIKVISSASYDPTNNKPEPGLRGWMTHIQAGAVAGTFNETETPLADSNLASAEDAALEMSCSFAITLGSGYGVCSCTPEDHDF